MCDRSKCIGQLANDVLSYLAQHPDACDTAHGVCQWWIPRQRLHEAQADVDEALELLRSRGDVSMRLGLDGVALYCARPGESGPSGPTP
jgi:hypothetical protein